MNKKSLMGLVVASCLGSVLAAGVEAKEEATKNAEVVVSVDAATGESFLAYVKSLRGTVVTEEVLAELNARYAQFKNEEEKTAAVAIVINLLDKVVLFDAQKDCFVLAPAKKVLEPKTEDVTPAVAPAVRAMVAMSATEVL